MSQWRRCGNGAAVIARRRQALTGAGEGVFLGGFVARLPQSRWKGRWVLGVGAGYEGGSQSNGAAVHRYTGAVSISAAHSAENSLAGGGCLNGATSGFASFFASCVVRLQQNRRVRAFLLKRACGRGPRLRTIESSFSTER